MERGKTYPMSELETSLHKENTHLRARIAELEKLAKEMADALSRFAKYNSAEENDVSLIDNDAVWVQCESAISRYREVCGGEK